MYLKIYSRTNHTGDIQKEKKLVEKKEFENHGEFQKLNKSTRRSNNFSIFAGNQYSQAQ